MSSVTQRINEIKQPRGGYIKPSSMEVIEMKKNEELYESENVAPSITGMVVDYMTRFLMTGDKKEAFSISIRGAEIARANAEKYLKHIKKLDEKSIVNACKLVTFDVWYRNTMNAMYAKGPEETNPDKKTIDNIRIMIERSLEFWKLYGSIIKDGFTFEPHGYTNVVNTGDGDYLTVDTLWDFKVSKAKPTNKHTLQLLMYWIMGQHSGQEIFKEIKYIGIFNPRLNTVYKLSLNSIPNEVIRRIEDEVICY